MTRRVYTTAITLLIPALALSLAAPAHGMHNNNTDKTAILAELKEPMANLQQIADSIDREGGITEGAVTPLMATLNQIIDSIGTHTPISNRTTTITEQMDIYLSLSHEEQNELLRKKEEYIAATVAEAKKVLAEMRKEKQNKRFWFFHPQEFREPEEIENQELSLHHALLRPANEAAAAAAQSAQMAYQAYNNRTNEDDIQKEEEATPQGMPDMTQYLENLVDDEGN